MSSPSCEAFPAKARDELIAAIGARFILDRPEDLALYEYDGSVDKSRPAMVVFPRTTGDVVKIVRITSKYNMIATANFHDLRLVKMPDGEIFNTITYGKTLMGAYGPNVTVTDRWAIVAYVRALERSKLALVDDVPEALKSRFKK